jgi:putative Holliday junction resolvase
MDIVRQYDVAAIVIGLPLSMDGSEGPQAEKTRAFAAALSSCTDIPVHFQDERLTTVQARRAVRDARKPDRNTRYDAAAAALILQAYLEATGY